MLTGLLALWRGIRHVNQRGYIYVWGNLLCVALSLPLVTMPAAWAALVKMSHEAYHNPSANLETMWSAFRQYWKQGLVLFALNALVIGVNLTNLLAYANRPEPLYALLRAAWLLILFVWLSVQLLLWPFFFEMERPTLAGAMRNALVMIARSPLLIFSLWLGLAPVVVLSTLFPAVWLLLTLSVLASAANSAVFDRLRAEGFKQPLPNRDG
jgi:uncharacterized membrane protein YesL